MVGCCARSSTRIARRPAPSRWTCAPAAAGEQPRLLRRGAADVAFMHHQAGLDGLDSEVLLIEHQIAVLPAGHRLAASSDVRLAELEDELLPADQVAANPSEALQL